STRQACASCPVSIGPAEVCVLVVLLLFFNRLDTCRRAGRRAHAPGVGGGPGARVCNEGKSLCVCYTLTSSSAATTKARGTRVAAGGRLLHGRAPGRRRDPLHRGAHPSRRPPGAAGLPPRPPGPDAASRHDPGGVQERVRAGAADRAEDAGGDRGGPTHAAHQHLLHLLRSSRGAQVRAPPRPRTPPRDPFQTGVLLSRGKSVAEATEDILRVQLPELKERMSAGALGVDNIDVFCERGVFDLGSTRAILQAGKDMGLNINFHGDELHPMNAAQLGAELGALAISHLEEVTDEGIAAMATAGTAAVLLPTTAYILRLPQPRARDMLEAGVIVALGSDFNPNAYCCSMPIVMHLACVNMKMSMPEALAAATINAAYALRRSDTHGSLEVNKHGDLLVLDTPRWEHLIYQLGGHQELIRYVVIKGNVVVDNNKTMQL
uniref:Probable imidazolonepropionase n=1 Tax=Gasterosteus aculeatus aculeatus TaxID=481459 RepID=A0AAQ4S2L9_GASAC